MWSAMNNTPYTYCKQYCAAVLPSTELSLQSFHKSWSFPGSSVKSVAKSRQTTASCASLSYQMQTQPSARAPGAWLRLGTKGRTAGWSWTWRDGEDVYRRGKRGREKFVTALLCLIRGFCFDIIKGFTDIKSHLFYDLRWSEERFCRSTKC